MRYNNLKEGIVLINKINKLSIKIKIIKKGIKYLYYQMNDTFFHTIAVRDWDENYSDYKEVK